MNAFVGKLRSQLSFDPKVLKNFFWLMTVYATTMVAGIVIVRFLPTKAFGEYNFFMAVMLFMGVFTLPGASTAIVQSMASGHERSYIDGIRIRVRHSLLAVGLMTIAIGYYAYRGNYEYAWYFALLGVAMPFYHCYNSFTTYFVAHQMFARYSLYMNGMCLVAFASLLAVVLTGHGLALLLPVSIGGICAMNLWGYSRVRREVAEVGTVDSGLQRYARQMTVNGAVPLAAGQIDRLLMFGMMGPEPVALYAVAVAIPEQVATVTDSIRTAFLAQFSRPEARFSLSQRQLILPSIMGIVGTIAAVLLAPAVLHFLFNGKYDQICHLAQFACLAMAMAIPQKVMQVYLESQKAISQLHRLQIVGALVKIVLLVGLVPWFGVLGAVTALVAMRLTLFGYTWILVNQILQKSKAVSPVPAL